MCAASTRPAARPLRRSWPNTSLAHTKPSPIRQPQARRRARGHRTPKLAWMDRGAGAACAATVHAGAGGNGHAFVPASDKQLEYARTLSQRIPGMDDDRLEARCQRMHGRGLVELSRRRDASLLIGTLQETLDGEAELDILLRPDAP